jgi:hypothetical protein
MVYAFAVVAALIVATGEVVQQRMAAQAPPQDNLSPRLLLWLVQQPRWLAGVGCSLAGNIAFAAALNRGSVVLVESVFVIRLIFGLVIAALWGWHRVPLRDVLGGLCITLGLVAFLLVGKPQAGARTVTDFQWALGAGIPVVIAAFLGLVARSHRAGRRALLLGLGAGICFGVQASLIQAAVGVMTDNGIVALLTGWHGYAVVVVALLGMLLVQSAFESAPLDASYPGVVTAQLLTAIGIGVLVLGGRLSLGAWELTVMVAALLAMVAGIFIITRSRLVAGDSASGATHQSEVAHGGQGSQE